MGIVLAAQGLKAAGKSTRDMYLSSMLASSGSSIVSRQVERVDHGKPNKQCTTSGFLKVIFARSLLLLTVMALQADESRVNLLATSPALQPDLEQGTPGQPGQGNMAARSNVMREYLESSSHPIALIFFIAFRLGALLTYLLGSIFTDNFTLIFVITILLLAFDFWTVKNVSGRLLVGLRWWNEIQEDGSNKWVFESANPNRAGNAKDSRLFWTILYATPVLWVLLAFTCIFTFKFAWLVIVVVAIILNLANVYGYTQCDKDAKRKWATGLAAQSAFGSLGGTMGGFAGKMFSSGVSGLFSSRG